MSLPDSFQFSQSSLQDYVDCKRRFQLRYIQQRAWPAVEAEPAKDNELYMQRGSQFHHMAHQYWLGVDNEKIASQVEGDEVLSRWWENFTGSKDFGRAMPNIPSLKTLPEINLSAPIGDFRIMAKYDLLTLKTLRVSESNHGINNQTEDPKGFVATIYDWKTSRKQPKREWLTHRLQTRVYPYLLAKAGSQLNDGAEFKPEQIEMIYWYSDFPDQPAHFPYSKKQFDEDEAYLSQLISEIQIMGNADAPLTEDERRCKFCVYRSLCNRGIEAGPLNEIDDLSEAEGFEVELDFDDIAEIEY
ncbi:MAG: PD-(D/E)XK nuclease family protein [Anaerolineales bacterium]|nr:PD-(D/E)XK nuclease family protein [Chloroflexota bacterium]MBL6982909.1 PD-(D/E)XK nuclease family protein [Anaerolineales bacterium]